MHLIHGQSCRNGLEAQRLSGRGTREVVFHTIRPSLLWKENWVKQFHSLSHREKRKVRKVCVREPLLESFVATLATSIRAVASEIEARMHPLPSRMLNLNTQRTILAA